MSERDQTKIDLTTVLEAAATKAEDFLFDQKRVAEIDYKDNLTSSMPERMKASQRSNEAFLKQLLSEGGNVYALWARAQGTNDWRLQYIGQRKSKSIRERLCQHLFSKHKSTGAQLNKVRGCLENSADIGVSVIQVIPDEARSAIEEILIKRKQPSWNIHGQ